MAVCGKCIHKNVCVFCKEMGFENVVRANDFNCKDYIPTADVAEVKHGEWAWIADDSPMCTYCGKVFDTNDDADAGITWLYCPNCGAKMDGGKAE